MVSNKNMLKAKRVENGLTQRQFAKAIGLCEASVIRKTSSPDKEFTISESLVIKDILHLTSKEYIDIFFGDTLEYKTK